MSIDMTASSRRFEERPRRMTLWRVYQLLKEKQDAEKRQSVTITKKTSETDKEEVQGDIPEHDIKLELVWEGDVDASVRVKLPRAISVMECKKKLERSLEVPYRNIQLIKDGRKMKHKEKIYPKPGDKVFVEITLDSSDSESEDNLVRSTSSWSKTNILKVTTSQEKKYFEVAINRKIEPREFYGGYKNKRTGKLYYHAKIQTDLKHCPENNQLLVKKYLRSTRTRETQTLLPLIDEGVNTVVDKCVQMNGLGVYIPSITDRVIMARQYEEYNIAHKRMTPYEAVIILQRAWRHYLNMKKVLQQYKSIYDEAIAKENFRGSNLAEFRKQLIMLVTKCSYPRMRADFYDLYTVLGEWANNKKNEIRKVKSGFACKVSLAEIQATQRKGLLAIEGHRIRARKENLKKQEIFFLERTASCRVRMYPKGNKTFIDDLNIERARVFKEMYANYSRKDVTKEERIEILTSIKDCLSSFDDYNLMLELVEILQREIDLMLMGVEERHLRYLKKRFETLFIDTAKNPEINPQAKYYRSSLRTAKKYAMYRCSNCQRVLYPSYMFMHLRMKKFKVCTSCMYMQITATASVNLAPYKRILMALQASEMEKGCRSAVPFLLQPTGMYFLVNVLWNGRSIVSGSQYLPGLKVTRWLPNREWAMWNMIVLTEIEAFEHEQHEDPLNFYSHDFVLNVMNRNILGRIHFNIVADIDEKFTKREPMGILPKDHLLYINPKMAIHRRKQPIHPFLEPRMATFGGKVGSKRDVST